jgi:hypothetical protein
MTNQQVADTINHLGGRALTVMTGAKDFIRSEKDGWVRFKVMGGLYIKITLNHLDLYDIEAFKMRSLKRIDKGSEENIYFDQLREAFERVTGLTLTVPTIIDSRTGRRL